MSFDYKSIFFEGMALFLVAIFIALFTSWDLSLSHFFILSPTDYNIPITKAISKIGSFSIITPLTILLGVWLWVKKRHYEALWVVMTMGSCRVIFALLKLIVARARPVFDEPLTHAISYSFPSGHSVNSITFLLVCYLIFSQRKSILVICIIGTILIGWTRLALGAHWLSDVIAGWGCGLIWISITYKAKINTTLQNYVGKYLPHQ